MLAYDVFTDEAFHAIEVTEAVGNIVYIPQTLNRLNLFEVEPMRTTDVAITKKNDSLVLVPTTERGAQETLLERDTRSVRKLSTVRLAQTDRINAASLQNIVAENMPFDAALQNALDEVDSRQRKMMRKLEFTREYHRLAAIQGYLLDADGSVLFNYFEEFGFTAPAAILFDFKNATDGSLRTFVSQNVARPMSRQLNSRLTPTTRIGALCGDNFFDKLTQAPEIRQTYLNYAAASELRESNIWGTFPFAGVEWMNFRGTDDGSTIAIGTNDCKFFPIGATDVFKEYRAPGEDFEFVNELGREFYSMVSPDPRPNRMAYVDAWLYAYNLLACIAPDVLMKGTLAAGNY